MSYNYDMRILLEDLIKDLNAMNQPDMLNGYLNSLADEYNHRLDGLDMDGIQVIGEEE